MHLEVPPHALVFPRASSCKCFWALFQNKNREGQICECGWELDLCVHVCCVLIQELSCHSGKFAQAANFTFMCKWGDSHTELEGEHANECSSRL